jgi:hypothetical protein
MLTAVSTYEWIGLFEGGVGNFGPIGASVEFAEDEVVVQWSPNDINEHGIVHMTTPTIQRIFSNGHEARAYLDGVLDAMARTETRPELQRVRV